MLIQNKKLFLIFLFYFINNINLFCFSTPLKLFILKTKSYDFVGSGSLVGKTNHILTVAHLITVSQAKNNITLNQQFDYLQKQKVIFLSPIISCTEKNSHNKFLDAVILIPLNSLYIDILDKSVLPLEISKNLFCLDNTTFHGATTGKHEDTIFFFKNFSTDHGDSGSVIFNKNNLQAVGVIQGRGNFLSGNEEFPSFYFFPLDLKPGLIKITRFALNQIEITRELPMTCEIYKK